MPDSRKCRGSSALPSYMRFMRPCHKLDSRKLRGSESLPLRFRRPCHNQADEGALVKAISAAVVITAAFAAGLAHSHEAPKIRASINGTRRLNWEHHMDDLQNREAFTRYYRMPVGTFDKLVGLLAPHLETSAHMARVRSKSGMIGVHIRIAVALRILAVASYLDVIILFGLGQATVFLILWKVIDAINKTPAVGGFFFPQTEEECQLAAGRWKSLSTNGVFDHVVAAADGLFIKCKAPSPKDTANVTAYYSGSKSAHGINVQATCTHNMRFCNVSTISPGSTNDWVAWNRSCLPAAVCRLPPHYYIIGDAAYPVSDQLLTPYPGRGLDPGPDSFNFHLSQLRVKIEQSFGLLVSKWGILWRPLAVRFTGRSDLITAIFHLHNFLRDEKFDGVRVGEEDIQTDQGRPGLTPDGRLADYCQDSSWNTPAASRSGESSARLALRMILEDNKQWRPQYNLARNS